MNFYDKLDALQEAGYQVTELDDIHLVIDDITTPDGLISWDSKEYGLGNHTIVNLAYDHLLASNASK